MKSLTLANRTCSLPSDVVRLPASGHSGGVDLLAVGSDGTTIQYVPTQATWQGCIVNRTTGTINIPAGSTTAIIYDTEERDTLNLYNTSTGYFRPNKTGLWRITAAAVIGGTTGTVGRYSDIRIQTAAGSNVGSFYSTRTQVASVEAAPALYFGSSVFSLTSGSDYTIAVNNGDTTARVFYASTLNSRFIAEFISE